MLSINVINWKNNMIKSRNEKEDEISCTVEFLFIGTLHCSHMAEEEGVYFDLHSLFLNQHSGPFRNH